jgi:hypothetical protein
MGLTSSTFYVKFYKHGYAANHQAMRYLRIDSAQYFVLSSVTDESTKRKAASEFFPERILFIRLKFIFDLSEIYIVMP